ncbi:exodeoxyribonuclease VII small subunit [Anaerolineae bacterium CFX9]|jgi:exodeoxyribonuclease VII small subunit|nr:exodeoxyribonuclease VII small subunit [Anaerolineae bacterium CFX9]
MDENTTFETAYAELEAIVSQLDSGELTLEQSVALYERGRKLAAYCQTLLDQAELRVSQLEDNG